MGMGNDTGAWAQRLHVLKTFILIVSTIGNNGRMWSQLVTWSGLCFESHFGCSRENGGFIGDY